LNRDSREEVISSRTIRGGKQCVWEAHTSFPEPFASGKRVARGGTSLNTAFHLYPLSSLFSSTQWKCFSSLIYSNGDTRIVFIILDETFYTKFEITMEYIVHYIRFVINWCLSSYQSFETSFSFYVNTQLKVNTLFIYWMLYLWRFIMS